MEIFSKYPLKSLNSFGIEAYAKEFIEIKTDDELLQFIEMQKHKPKQILFLGGGSNILFTGDYNGTVVKISTAGKEIISEDDDNVLLRAASGEKWDGLVEYCVSRGWGGLENLSGIPGQVGSCPIQNIGAYGTELKDHFEAVEGIFLCTGEKFVYDSERCQFGYRDSIFKRALKGRIVITQVIFRLKKKPEFNLTYLALKQKLESEPSKEITLQRIRNEILEIRSAKLPDPEVIGNAGSFFKNPVVRQTQLTELQERNPGIVYFEVPGFQGSGVPEFQSSRVPEFQGSRVSDTADRRLPTAGFKLSAGWLIEQCGWKGYREGDAGVHKDQALVLVNYGKATGMEILELAGRVQRSVKEKFGVVLEKEVNVV